MNARHQGRNPRSKRLILAPATPTPEPLQIQRSRLRVAETIILFQPASLPLHSSRRRYHRHRRQRDHHADPRRWIRIVRRIPPTKAIPCRQPQSLRKRAHKHPRDRRASLAPHLQLNKPHRHGEEVAFRLVADPGKEGVAVDLVVEVGEARAGGGDGQESCDGGV